MRDKVKLSLLLIVLITLIFNANADPITLILAHVKTLVETIKVANNVIDVIGKYPPTLIEQVRAAFGPKKTQPPHQSYDFIVDLTRPTDIFGELKAYLVTFPLGKEIYDKKMQETKHRFIVNVVGRYNVGKTYVLRLLANIDLGDSFTERTVGISVSLPSPEDTNGTPMALIDTAGTRTPVAYEDETFNENSYQRQVSDSFIQEIALNSAEIFVLVVNQLTLDDQLYLKALTKRLKDKGLSDGDIQQRLLLLHNYFNLQTVAQVERVEETELQELFGAIKHADGYWLSNNFKHFVIAHTNSPAGEAYNKRTIENIRIMIKGARAALNPNVLNKITKEIELLLGKVLIEQQPEKSPQKSETLPRRAVNFIAAMFWQSSSNADVTVTNKEQVKVELEVKSGTIQPMNPLWFICPKRELSNNITLSRDLGFNHDGSVYVDFSSQFVPNINIVRINDNGDIGIRIECPSCEHVTAERHSMTSILVQGEKMLEPWQKQYVNTRRFGKFEMEISLHGLEKSLILSLGDMKTEYSDGVIRINVPSEKKDKKKIVGDEL